MMYRGGDITNFAKSFPVSGHSTSQYVVLLIGKFIVNNMLQFSSVQFFQRHCAESELFK